ncbi:pentapeptide repeat-containing protein [Romeriopsis navalis]|nr:pentapeptide repeat-containing protein [Romeriopsis navalis]
MLVRSFSLAFNSMGGTRFSGANLTKADFTNAKLKGANFADSGTRKTTLTRTCWKDAQQLEKARPGNSIFTNLQVLKLLKTGEGINQDFSGLNLRGANLDAAHLNGSNLKNADISQACLHKADLQNVNLTEAQAVGTNFTNAYLTGACLEAWNIEGADLSDIKCEYYFLRENKRERRPHDTDAFFAPGDFSNLYKKIINTVEILLKDGYRSLEAFQAAFQAVMAENPDITPDSLQKIERVGQKDARITLTVPEETDKAQLEKKFQQVYEENRQLLSQVEKYKILSEAETRHADKFESLATLLAKRPITIQNTQTTGDNTVTNQDNQAISAGQGSNINLGTQTGNVLNFGTISGNLTNTLNQLQSSNQTNAADLTDYLTQLQSAITADPNLPDADKAETLQKVDDIAKAATHPEDKRRHGALKGAIDFLKGTINAVPKAEKFAAACKKLLPLITTALGAIGLMV